MPRASIDRAARIQIGFTVFTPVHVEEMAGRAAAKAVMKIMVVFPRPNQSTRIGLQARAGIGYELSPTAVVSLGYRFFDTLDPEFDAQNGTSFDSEYRSHTVEVGLRYKF